MQTGRISSSIAVGGISFSATVTRQAEGQVSHVVELAAGFAGQISAAGVDNLATGHGIEIGDVIDVHWDDPTDGTHKCRRGLEVDASDTNDIEFDETPAGEGDALPAVGTDVVVSVQSVVNTDWDGDDLEMIAVKSTQRASADFRDAAASLHSLKLPAGETWSWASEQGFANPFTGNPVTEIRLSNGSTSAATFYVGLLYQSV